MRRDRLKLFSFYIYLLQPFNTAYNIFVSVNFCVVQRRSIQSETMAQRMRQLTF